MITLHEPRAITRLIYDAAIQRAATDTARSELLGALQWYEQKWAAQDNAARQEAIESQRAAAAAAPTPPSAVETHGFDSEQAEAKREQRRQKRLADQKARQEAAEAKKAGGGT